LNKQSRRERRSKKSAKGKDSRLRIEICKKYTYHYLTRSNVAITYANGSIIQTTTVGIDATEECWNLGRISTHVHLDGRHKVLPVEHKIQLELAEAWIALARDDTIVFTQMSIG
jgi:hypothetical protein